MTINMYKMTERMNINSVKVTPECLFSDGQDDVYTQQQKECDLMLNTDGMGWLYM